jgi:hypothetical protein
MKLVVYLIGIIVLLSFILFLQIRLKSSISESFNQNIPTPIPTRIRSDNTCSDPDSSFTFDRVANANYRLMAEDVSIPPSRRNNTLAGTATGGTLDLSELQTKCTGGTTGATQGTKVFVDTGKPSLRKDNGLPYLDNLLPYNIVDVYCCRGELYTVPGTNEKICLAACPSNYTVSSNDQTQCVRTDGNCVYTADLSANISDSWLRTCAQIYKQNVNLTSTIQSISSVVSTFSFQTNSIRNDYLGLQNRLYTTATTDISKLNNRNTNFNTITNQYVAVSNLQDIINNRYNSLKADKLKFDTLYKDFGCSNYQYS